MTEPVPATGEPRTVSRGLTSTLRWFLYGAAAASLGATVTTYREIGAFDEYLARGTPTAEAAWDAAVQASEGLLGVFSLAATVVAVLTIVWWYQAYLVVERLDPPGRSWSAGWAIGGWFIPIANLIIPKMVLNEIDRASVVVDEGTSEWRQRRLLPAANWWWAFWVFASLTMTVGISVLQAQAERGALDPDAYRSGLWLLGIGLAAVTGAAFAGAASIRVIGSRLSPPR